MRRSILLSTAALGIAILPLGAAQAQDPFEGPYIGLHAGVFSGNVDVNAGKEVFGGPVDGFMGGVLAGYNFHKAPDRTVMWGIEADVGFGDVNGTGTEMCQLDCNPDVYGYEMNTDGHLRLRINFPQGMWNFYGAGGVAFGRLKLTEDDAVMYAGTFVGPSVGAGVEGFLGPNLIARAEALYDFYCDKNVEYVNQEWGNISLSGFTVRGALIFKLPSN